MPMSQLEIVTVNRGLLAAKLVLEQLKPVLDQVNVIYDSAGGVKETIDQAGLDARPEFSGLTKAQLDDGMYVLTSTLRQAIANGLPALSQLAARVPG